MNIAVIRCGGKQYVVQEDDELYVDKLDGEVGKQIELETLLLADTETHAVEVGKPVLDKKIHAEILVHEKGEKLHILRFKAKARYRKRKGFRHDFTNIKILPFSVKKEQTKKEIVKGKAKKDVTKRKQSNT